MKIKSIPPTYFMLGFFTIILSYFIFPSLNVIVFPVNLFGIIVILFGFILVSKSYSLFQKYQTPHNFDDSTSLIKEGVFKYSRNPMYLGMVLILIGLAISFGNLVSLIIPLAFFIIIHLMFIPFEEKKLEAIFKESYITYKHQVRKWF